MQHLGDVTAAIRLHQQSGMATFDPLFGGDRGGVVAGGKNNFEAGIASPRAVGQLETVDPLRHHDISEQQIHPAIGFEDCQTGLRVFGGDDRIPERSDQILGKFPDFGVSSTTRIVPEPVGKMSSVSARLAVLSVPSARGR